jgi:hypothetical protein
MVAGVLRTLERTIKVNVFLEIQYFLLKGLSHQIRSAWT